MRRVTADTNVLVSALVFGGKPLVLLDLAQAGEIQLALSDGILNESLRILRDKFYRTPEQLNEIEAHFARDHGPREAHRAADGRSERSG